MIPAGATYQSVAYDLYGVNSPEAASALEAAWGFVALVPGRAIFDPQQTLWIPTETTVPAYYTVQSGDTWESITQAIYGLNDPTAVASLQAERPPIWPGTGCARAPGR